ncbi:uncharacterized protein TEOVI_000381400 [Trypanosoma equiperdum]|uniref:Ribosomal protein L30p/L7e n=1 Tax=Trypanosoma equiperdum TaxID=5694 RepID=A0A1G4IIT2_TRYEQ|nr:hypothetical protein, conserved [Trypanosoma equiperdum]
MMRRMWVPTFSAQRQHLHHAMGLKMLTYASTPSGSGVTSAASNEEMNLHDAAAIAPGPYRRVGNIFIVHCDDHPFKHSWEVNRMLRELRLEFKGQTTIVPDIPQVRKRIWRVRHIVKVDVLDLDEAKALIGVPEHISFTDLASQLPPSFGRVKAVPSPVIRSKMNFMKLRRMRLRDVLHRDALELRLLELKRSAMKNAEQQKHAQKDERTDNKEGEKC